MDLRSDRASFEDASIVLRVNQLRKTQWLCESQSLFSFVGKNSTECRAVRMHGSGRVQSRASSSLSAPRTSPR